MHPFSKQQLDGLLSRLQDTEEFVFLESSRVDGENHRSLLFTSPLHYLICRPAGNALEYLGQLEQERQRGHFVAGWFAYEFGYRLEPSLHGLLNGPHDPPCSRPLAVFGVFRSPEIFEHQLPPEADSPCLSREESKTAYLIGGVHPAMSRQDYLAAVRRVQDYLAAGDSYQVNLTLKLLFSFRGSPAALYKTLRGNQRVSWGGWVRQQGMDILSFSPELFFSANRERVRVRPMKGTMARGRTLAEDAVYIAGLQQDFKNRAENVMIVDLLRNDLARMLWGRGGRVAVQSLCTVERYETLLQMTSTIDALLPPGQGGVSLERLIPALFPCGSVTGAPKIRTMEIIRELEAGPRGVYCGAIGFAGPEEAVFNVPIRTVELTAGQGEMGIGSGITHDSAPEREWEESLLKARFLTHPRPAFQLIETLLWRPGSGYWLLEEHLARLSDSAIYFLFPEDAAQRAHQALLAEAEQFSRTPRRVRLLLDRDGEIVTGSQEWTACPRDALFPPLPGKASLKVGFSSFRTDPGDSFLFHKTTCRASYDREYREAVNRGLFDCLYCNTRDELTESSIANIFLRQGEQLLTPPVHCGLLAGTLRSYLLRQYPGQVVETVLRREDVARAEAIYLGNSVRGLVEVMLEEVR